MKLSCLSPHCQLVHIMWLALHKVKEMIILDFFLTVLVVFVHCSLCISLVGLVYLVMVMRNLPFLLSKSGLVTHCAAVVV